MKIALRGSQAIFNLDPRSSTLFVWLLGLIFLPSKSP